MQSIVPTYIKRQIHFQIIKDVILKIVSPVKN